MTMDDVSAEEIQLDDDALAYEEDLIRNPYCLRAWLRYIDHMTLRCKDVNAVNMVFERALKEFPGSYKLWSKYLQYRRQDARLHCISSKFYEDINGIFERALAFMHKMPRTWIEYGEFLMSQCKITRTRRVFDRALKSLPITQHDRIWPLYIELMRTYDIPETAIYVFRRYIKLFPERSEEYIDYLLDLNDQFGLEKCRDLSVNIYEECATIYLKILNDENFVSMYGKSKHQLWREMCSLASKHPLDMPTLKFEQIIKQGIDKYRDQVGVLWNSLANYYTRAGLLEKARDVYEEALIKVMTVRDFAQVFDAYSLHEEEFINKMIAKNKAEGTMSNEDEDELELRVTRLELLLDRRPLLLNSVLLRQNPHKVSEWLHRVQLLVGRKAMIVETFNEAVSKVDPAIATDKVDKLWIEFARVYEKQKNFEEADAVFERAIQVPFKTVEDLANVYCEWAEMKIRAKQPMEAIRVLDKATAPPPYKVDYFDTTETVQRRIYKSLKVWSMYADLEESFGTFKSCKAVYDNIIDLRICSPQIIVNYANFLEENNYYEEAFRAYEKGISLFSWPTVFDIWIIYLTNFMKRYQGTKIERARDLFEQCLEQCTAKYSKPLYLLYAKLEDEYGLARRALKVYERAVEAVPVDEKLGIFDLYIKRTAEQKGVTATREIFEKAIDILNDADTRKMCLRYAELERKLGEIDRARSIYLHCSQLCDPRITQEFWQTWKEFETKHGSEDTLRDMLRIRRSVQATYNVQVNYMAAQMLGSASETNVNAAIRMSDPMKSLDEKAAELAKRVVEERLKNSGKKEVMFVSGGLASNSVPDTSDPNKIILPSMTELDANDKTE